MPFRERDPREKPRGARPKTLNMRQQGFVKRRECGEPCFQEPADVAAEQVELDSHAQLVPVLGVKASGGASPAIRFQLPLGLFRLIAVQSVEHAHPVEGRLVETVPPAYGVSKVLVSKAPKLGDLS